MMTIYYLEKVIVNFHDSHILFKIVKCEITLTILKVINRILKVTTVHNPHIYTLYSLISVLRDISRD